MFNARPYDDPINGNDMALDDIATILQVAEHNMAIALDGFKPVIEAAMFPFKSNQMLGRYPSVNSDVDREQKENQKKDAVKQIEELKWVIAIELHNIRCISEEALIPAVEHAPGDSSSQDSAFFEQTEALRKLCREFIDQLEATTNDCKERINRS
jgi:hypothetical protein